MKRRIILLKRGSEKEGVTKPGKLSSDSILISKSQQTFTVFLRLTYTPLCPGPVHLNTPKNHSPIHSLNAFALSRLIITGSANSGFTSTFSF